VESAFRVEDLNEKNAADWERLNEQSDHGSFFHTLKWKRILELRGYRPFYFIVYQDDQPMALCPFYQQRIKNFKAIATLPDSPYNHIVIDNADSFAPELIRTKCRSIAKNLGLSFALFGIGAEPKDHFSGIGGVSFPIIGTMALDLHENSLDTIWSRNLKHDVRNKIRRFDYDGFELREIHDVQDLELFYQHYRKNTREYQHSNPHPFSHFKQILDNYSPKELRITLLQRREEVAGGLMMFLYDPKKTMYLRYLSINRDMPNRYTPYWYLCWDALKTAARIGYTSVVFGRTPPNEVGIYYHIKAQFGCYYQTRYVTVLPLSYRFRLVRSLYTLARRLHINIPIHIDA
jgi:hypothetical protein